MQVTVRLVHAVTYRVTLAIKTSRYSREVTIMLFSSLCLLSHAWLAT